MRTLNHLDPERQQKIPARRRNLRAHRAPVWAWQDSRRTGGSGFKYLDPIGFEQVRVAVESRRKEGEAFMARWRRVRDGLKEAGITGRVESASSGYTASTRNCSGSALASTRFNDLYAMRVITNLGAGLLRRSRHHPQLVAAVPGRIKDFIAMTPAQSLSVLHTSGYHRDGRDFRDPDSHGRMPQDVRGRHPGRTGIQDGPSPRDKQRWPGSGSGGVAARRFRSNEFLSTLESRSLPEEVYHLHAQGQGAGSAASESIDFAYSIHYSRSGTVAPARRSTDAWFRCATSCIPATSSK